VSREAARSSIPGHGRLCDQFDVIEYRDMVTIIRDRVRDIDQARTIARDRSRPQVRQGHTGRYGNAAATGRRTVRRGGVQEPEGEAVRRSLAAIAGARAGLFAAVAVRSRTTARRAASASAREHAPIDLTGYWVSYVTENWRYRMVHAAKGEYRRIPASPGGAADHQRVGSGRRRTGRQPVQVVWRRRDHERPGRLHITWQDADTLRIDTDAGKQTRLFRFTARARRAAGSVHVAGESTARWERVAAPTAVAA
jgi:hypothetical protein